eukprot:6675163-Prymnesium_polylepis.1
MPIHCKILFADYGWGNMNALRAKAFRTRHFKTKKETASEDPACTAFTLGADSTLCRLGGVPRVLLCFFVASTVHSKCFFLHRP